MLEYYEDRTVCTCDHLTNFAVLMSLNPSVIEVTAVIHSFIVAVALTRSAHIAMHPLLV